MRMIIIFSEKGKRDMAMRRMKEVEGICQASSSPTTSMETSSAQAVLISRPLAGRKGEDAQSYLDMYTCKKGNKHPFQI